MNKDFHVNNRKVLVEQLEDKSIAVLFSGIPAYKSADEVYSFTPNRNFYYLTGLDRDKMILLMNKRNGIVNETLFIEENDPVMAKWVGEKMSEAAAKDISGINDVRFIKDFHSSFAALLNRFEYENLYLDMERAEWDIPMSEAQSLAKQVNEKYPYVQIKNIFHKISDMRLIKSKDEIDEIKKAICITNEGIKNVVTNAKPGMMEYELEAYFDFTLRSHGVKDRAFKTITASGKNAAILHYTINNSKTNENDLVLLDLGAQWNYYNGDISFTFPVSGKFTERQKQLYNIVLKANKEVIKIARPGIKYSVLNDIAKKVLTEGCKEIGLIKEDSEISKYYFHGVSHYLGLDTHDVGTRDTELKPGMVLTVEPGLYIEEESIGIRIEDDIHITEDGCEVLSKDIIKGVEEIEAFMAQR